MGRLTELLFDHPAIDELALENATSFRVSTSSTLESSLFNLMENFERDDITESPAVCKLHVPSWLNVWCVVITVCILAVLVVLGLLMRYVQIQRPRQVRSECYNCFPASPEYYSEHFLDRNQIMVY